MHVETHGAEIAYAVVALAIFAHAWHGRMQGDPRILSAIGWVVNVLAAVALAACWVSC